MRERERLLKKMKSIVGRVCLMFVVKEDSDSGLDEWWSKRCGRLRPQVKKRPPNFKQ